MICKFPKVSNLGKSEYSVHTQQYDASMTGFSEYLTRCVKGDDNQ